MWSALIGGVVSLLAGRQQSRAASQAREESSRYSREDMQYAAKLERINLRHARKLANKDAKRDMRMGLRASRLDRRDAFQMDRKAAKANLRLREKSLQQDRVNARKVAQINLGLTKEKLHLAEGAARRQRRVALKDEANRFTRLRKSAEKAGFNPLTVLGAGYVGPSAVPTGFLSGETVLDATASVSALSSGLGAPQMGGAFGGGGYSSGFSGMSTIAANYAGIMSSGRNGAAAIMGDNRARADQMAREGSLNAFRIGLDAASLFDQMRATSASIRQGNEADNRERERISLATRELDWMMQQSPRAQSESWLSPRMGSGSAGGPVSQAAYGQAVEDSGLPANAVPRNPDGTVANRDLGIGGVPMNVSESTSPAQYWEDEYGEIPAEVIGTGHAIVDLSGWINPAGRIAAGVRTVYNTLPSWDALSLSLPPTSRGSGMDRVNTLPAPVRVPSRYHP